MSGTHDLLSAYREPGRVARSPPKSWCYPKIPRGVRPLKSLQYETPSGIRVIRAASSIPFHKGLKPLLHKLDTRRGMYLSSGYEYPERYSRWDIASICPPIEIVARQREVAIRP